MLAGCPIIGFLVGASVTLFLHWASGEGEIRASGNPWMMVGGMVVVPVATLIGAGAGLAGCISTLLAWVWDDQPIRIKDDHEN